VSALPLLSRAERHQVVVEWNATETAYRSDRCLHELFEEQAATAPDAVAVAFADTALTYGELNARSNRLARYLRAVGVGPDTRVALCLERSAEMVVGLLAVLKAGGAYVPLDPSYPPDRLSFMLQDSAPVAVLTHAQVPGAVLELLRSFGVALLDVERDAPRWSAEPARNLDRGGLTPEHLAYVIYTSGTTGLPKGVMVEHRGVCNLALVQGDRFAFDRDSRVLQYASLSFDASVMETVMALCHGAALHVVAPGAVLVGDDLAATLREAKISHTLIPPTVLVQLPAGDGFPSLRVLLSGADVVTKALVERWAPGRRFINAYGPTEATVFSSLYECDSRAAKNPPIGRPIANARMYVLDVHREPVPIGVAGELYIGGVQVARGYLNRPELTAERFIASPFVAGDRLYKTGDLARYLPDGNIEYLGRNDFQVKIRGFRIELGEIEARLSAHPAVREAVALAREDVPGEKRLTAYYTSRDGEHAGAEALRSHLLGALPEYMVPAAYVHLEALPLTRNGKLDRHALPPPDDSAYAVRAYEPPLGAVEEAIAQIWCEMLDVERVGRYDNFFELGGHSFLAVKVMNQLRTVGLHLDATTFFKAPSLAEIASAARDGKSDNAAAPENAIPDGARAITPQMLASWWS
jgi:amino acid adenylation domain-containing protein